MSFTPSAVSKSSNFVATIGGDTTADVLADLLDNRIETYQFITSIASQFYGATPPSSPDVGTLWRCSTTAGSYLADTIYRWNGSAWVADILVPPDISVRNSVLQGNVDSNGNAALFTGSSSALTVQLNATTTPLIISWMDGNDAGNGEKNKVGIVSADSATFWSGLPQNSTVYLYVELSGSTISGNYSTIAPKEQYNAPAHSAGLDWIDYNKGEVYNSNGSTWTKKYRVYVGTATTDATKVTGVYVYPYLVPESSLRKAQFALTVYPNSDLTSATIDLQIPLIINKITIAGRTASNATKAPSASTDAVLYKDGSALDTRAFTTADTSVSGLSVSLAAGLYDLRLSAVNGYTGATDKVTVTWSGVRA